MVCQPLFTEYLLTVPLQAQEATELKAALLLFLTSHAVVWALPQGMVPTSMLLGTLRLLQQAKQLLLPSLPDLVASKAGREASADTQPPWGAPPLLLLVCQVGVCGCLPG